MDWPASVIWWHVYPLGFVDAERRRVESVHHRLPKLVTWLDYLVELGANGLLLAPVFDSGTHGYDTLDHFRIDPRLGDDSDFQTLLDEARRRGIRVCLDGVFNHLSRSHDLIQRAINAGPDTDEGSWVKWHEGYPWAFEGHERLVELNLSNPSVQDYIVEVMNHWLSRGVDGWRLDAAYAPGAAAWRPILERVKRDHPEAWILGEVIHGDYSEFVTTSGVDSVTQYELWHAIWDALADGNFFSLQWTLGRHHDFCRTFRPQTFISNHDVTRIASKLPDPRDVEIAATLLMLLPGIPSIYAGDEQGFTGVKEDHAYGDDAVRPPFPDTPAGLLPFGADLHSHYQAMISLRRQHPWLVDAEVTTSQVTNTWITITLTGPDAELALDLNIGEETVDGVDPHGWRIR
ncbi:MAG: alpha-amylase family glycosyl hydrolase [Propionicimonas sp.]